MKGRTIPLEDVRNPQDAMRRILSVRLAEVLAQAGAFAHPQAEALHDLRIACKRLRYTLELFAYALPQLRSAERHLARLQEELGEAHDCDVLLQRATEFGTELLAERALGHRGRHVARAANLWARALAPSGAFSSLLAFTGFGANAA